MQLEYVPLLRVQRDLCSLPRDRTRFEQYLRTIFQDDDLGMRAPLLAMNPMSKEHVGDLLDQLIELDCDEIGAQATRELLQPIDDVPGKFKIALVLADDLKGAWTNRYANEFEYRFGMWSGTAKAGADPTLPRWLKYFWIFGVLWTSELPDPTLAREAVLTSIYRAAYVLRHGQARTLGAMMTQEGAVMAQAGCVRPTLDKEDIEFTRKVLEPLLHATNKRTCMECLFGDEPGRTLGFTPQGLSPWAGLALALHDAIREQTGIRS